VSFSSLDIAVQSGFGDLECPANVRNGVSFLVEIPGNTYLSVCQGVWSAAFASSSTRSCQSCLCPLPNEVSFKLSQSTEDVEDQLSPAGGINILCNAFEANPLLLKHRHGGNQIPEGSA
jgi:hypothetical protein